MATKHDQFLEKWHHKADWLLDGALEFLAGQEIAPFSDGVLGEWIDQLSGFRFEERHTPAIVTLVGKTDPLLSEAGIRLAIGAERSRPGIVADLEDPLAAVLSRSWVDPWIVRAIVELLGRAIWPREPALVPVYQGLVKWLDKPELPSGPRTVQMIMRNMHIRPREDVLLLFEQNALQSLEPSARDRVYLPVLERQHQTQGWRATQAAVCRKMGFDPEEHRARLRGDG